MHKIALLYFLIAYTLCGKVFAQSDKYESFKFDLSTQIKSLSKLTKKQRLDIVRQIKTNIDKNIKDYEKLSENESIEEESKNRKILEQFHYLDIIFEPSIALIQQKKQTSKACAKAKNRTEIEGTQRQTTDTKLSDEAQMAMLIIKAFCS